MDEDEAMPLSQRFERVSDLLSYYGYESHYTAGQEDGTDWVVSYCLRVNGAQLKTVASPTETALLDYLRRTLPDEAARDWRSYALTLEGELGRIKRERRGG